MLELKTPNNIKTLVPQNLNEDNTQKFQSDNVNEIQEAKKFKDLK